MLYIFFALTSLYIIGYPNCILMMRTNIYFDAFLPRKSPRADLIYAHLTVKSAPGDVP